MTYDFAHRFLEVVIHLIYRLRCLILSLTRYQSLLHRELPYIGSILSIIGYILSNDVKSTGNSLLNISNALILTHKALGFLLNTTVGPLKTDYYGQSFKSLLSCNTCSGLLLGLIGSVEILNGNKGCRLVNLTL